MMKRLLLFIWFMALSVSLAYSQVINTGTAYKSYIVPNNVLPVVVKANPGTVYGVEAFNLGTSVAYLKLYNSTSSGVVCGTTTPYARYMIPAMAANAFGGVLIAPNFNGDAYFQGITACVTTGQADSDTGAPAATTFIVGIRYK